MEFPFPLVSYMVVLRNTTQQHKQQHKVCAWCSLVVKSCQHFVRAWPCFGLLFSCAHLCKTTFNFIHNQFNIWFPEGSGPEKSPSSSPLTCTNKNAGVGFWEGLVLNRHPVHLRSPIQKNVEFGFWEGLAL